MPETTLKSGIVFFSKPYKVDFIEFGYEHLNCDSIITESSKDDPTFVEVVAYASNEQFNNRLRSIYNELYSEGHCIMKHISSMEATSID